MSARKLENPKAALVTGAGSGLGYATAKKLAGLGWKVYGGVSVRLEKMLLKVRKL